MAVRDELLFRFPGPRSLGTPDQRASLSESHPLNLADSFGTQGLAVGFPLLPGPASGPSLAGRGGRLAPWDSALLLPGNPPLSAFCKHSLSTYYMPGAMLDGTTQTS